MTRPPPRNPASGDQTDDPIGPTEIASAVALVRDRLDIVDMRLLEHSPGPHIEQLRALVSSARDQADRIGTDGAAAATPGLGLWRLAEPGSLRAAADRTVRRSSGVAVLFPVMLTWFVLGVAEIVYANRYADAPAADRPSFFADWIAAPLWRGPAVLSLLIIASIGVIMWGYRAVDREQREADVLDADTHRWEAELHGPVERLRHLAESDRSEHDASSELHRAARRIDDAARSLAGSQTVVRDLASTLRTLGGSVGDLARATPELGKHAASLTEADLRLRAAAVEIGNRAGPIVTIVQDTEKAAETARDAAGRAERAMSAAQQESERSERLVSRSDQFRQALDEARAPFVAAAGGLNTSTGEFTRTAEMLATTVGDLQTAIRQVNWLALVADGLRQGDRPHHRPEAGP